VISNPEFRKFLKDQGFILVGWNELRTGKATEAAHPR
jgi:hypothetical protein